VALMRVVVLAALCLAVFPGPARAWGDQGHRAVAETARQLPLAPATRAAIASLLGNDDMAAVAVWLDDLRQATRGRGRLVDDAEVIAFNRRHPQHAEWHFVNLPLDSATFSTHPQFAGPENVAVMINRCIEVLETPMGRPIPMTRRQALRALIHLVADIHQPLHVSSGYYRLGPGEQAVLETDPVKARGLPGDRGGNLLRWGPGDTDQLHADWDVVLVERAAGDVDYRALASKLKAGALGKSWGATGDYRHDLAPAWALDALPAARAAYLDLRLERAARDPYGTLLRIEIRQRPDRDAYLDRHADAAARQLTKAAGRLAALLDRIKWP